VDLVASYSNRPELAYDLAETLRRLQRAQTEASAPSSVRSHTGRPPEQRRVEDRLSSEQIEALISSYRAGTTTRELAQRYGLGLTTVKRLLRDHGVRRRKPRGESAT
jgi:DNA invertase Pin-like site-specific DNA recombinase